MIEHNKLEVGVMTRHFLRLSFHFICLLGKETIMPRDIKLL
jgi:hypothetical protein